MTRATARREVVAYLSIVATGALGLALAFPGTSSDEPGPAPVLTLFVPILAVAAATSLLRGRGERTSVWRAVGFRPSGRRWWPTAVALPATIVSFGYAVAWAARLCDFDGLPGHVPGALAFLAVFSVLVLGEEVGWRGFLLPRMELLMTRRRAALATGAAHGLFHLPLLLLTNGYDSEGSRWIVVPGVVAVITFAGVLFAWFRIRSGSIWPVAIAHATVNASLLDGTSVLVTDRAAATAYVAGEGGVVTLLAVGAVAIWLLRRPCFDAVPVAGTTAVRQEPASDEVDAAPVNQPQLPGGRR